MWKEGYRVGVEKIDTQHQELFQRVTDFVKAIKGEGQWEQKVEKVKETLDFMQRYVIEHFAAEEVYQKEVGYINFKQHQQIHKDFKADVAKYAQKFEDTHYSEDIAQEFAGKLMTWLIYHVAIEDQKIGAYVRTRGGQA